MTVRRDMLRMLGSLGLAPWLTSAATHGASSQPSARLVAAWESTDGWRAGSANAGRTARRTID